MTDSEKLIMLKTLLNIDDDNNDSSLERFLKVAANKILNRAFPYDTTERVVPSRYSVLQCEIAAYLWNKRGAEGEISHSENGIARIYENADVPASLLDVITPFCGIPR